MSAALAAVGRAVAFRPGYVVTPADGQPAPGPKALFGGIVIALPLFGGAAAIGAFDAVPVLLSCSIGVFAVGVASDLFTLKPLPKLAAIIATASVSLFLWMGCAPALRSSQARPFSQVSSRFRVHAAEVLVHQRYRPCRTAHAGAHERARLLQPDDVRPVCAVSRPPRARDWRRRRQPVTVPGWERSAGTCSGVC